MSDIRREIAAGQDKLECGSCLSAMVSIHGFTPAMAVTA
jgi:hypothetical protein